MKQFVFAVFVAGMLSVPAMAQTQKDGVYYVNVSSHKVGRVSKALVKSGVNGAFVLGKQITLGALHLGKDALHLVSNTGKDLSKAGTAVAVDVKK